MTRTGELSRLEKFLTEPECVVLDVAGVQYIDTTFIRFLLSLKRHANKGDRSAVKIVGASDHLRRVLEITGLHKMFLIEHA